MTSVPVPTSQRGPSEQDYLDAARAYLSADGRSLSGRTIGELSPIYAAHGDFRAAVDSAFTAGWRAGYGQGRDDEAANLDIRAMDGDQG